MDKYEIGIKYKLIDLDDVPKEKLSKEIWLQAVKQDGSTLYDVQKKCSAKKYV